ncbi:MAG: hypothetical protein JSW62_04815 [Thermoplasmatales archaeon]|nr:MAG: hypothetical protein JSW62_04815 [Thermoplasmatales archaeon]
MNYVEIKESVHPETRAWIEQVFGLNSDHLSKLDEVFFLINKRKVYTQAIYHTDPLKFGNLINEVIQKHQECGAKFIDLKFQFQDAKNEYSTSLYYALIIFKE